MIKYLIPAILISFLFIRCTDNLGQRPLRVSDESNAWLPFGEDDTLLFTNKSNDTLIMTGQPVIRQYKYVTTNYNDETGDGNFYNYEFLKYTCLSKDSNVRFISELGFTSDNYQQDLIQYFNLKLIWDHSAVSISIIISDDYLSWPYDKSYDYNRLLDTFEFEGKTFYDVYVPEGSGPYTLYYSKSEGIIGFIGDNKTWKRIMK